MRRALPKKQSVGWSPGGMSEPDVLEFRISLLGLEHRLRLRECPGWTGESMGSPEGWSCGAVLELN